MGAAQHVDPALDEARQRDFRRAVGASVGLHLALLVLLLWAPSFSVPAPAGVIAVNLVSLPSQAPAAPAAKPAAAPPAHRPRPAPVVLPKEPVEPKPVAKAEPPKPQAKPQQRPPPTPQPPPEKDYADVMEQLRAETGEPAPEPAQQAEATAPAAAPGAGGGPGAPVSPEVAAWIRAARAHIRQSWVVPPGFRNEALQTVVEVELDASGGLLDDPRIVRASGNPWYDEGVVRSIRKASPLPPPPNAGRWTFVMISDEML